MVFLMAGGGLGGDRKQLDNRLLERLNGLLADVGGVDPTALDCRDNDALGLALLGASQQLVAQALRLVGSSQAAGFPEFAGFVDNTRHIAVGAGMSNHHATELPALAAFITNHRLIALAVAAGTLDIARVRCLATVAHGREQRFTQDLSGLLHNVVGLSFDLFNQRVQSWRLNTDPMTPKNHQTPKPDSTAVHSKCRNASTAHPKSPSTSTSTQPCSSKNSSTPPSLTQPAHPQTEAGGPHT